MTVEYDEDDFPEYERPNKSQMKRDAQALLELTKKMVDLSEAVWSEFSLPNDIIDELYQLKDTKQYGARKRQMKRIAKLLRHIDVTVAKQVVEIAGHNHAVSAATFHRVELWRDRLIAEGGAALTEYLSQNPCDDVQYLNQLIRNAKQELSKGRTPKSSKLLFKFLRENLAEI